MTIMKSLWQKRIVVPCVQTIRALNFQWLLGLAVLSLPASSPSGVAAHNDAVYRNDFEKAEPGQLSDEFLVIGGDFKVAKEGGNKFLELPGIPLDSYSALFGPTEREGMIASARVYGTA